MLPPHSDHGPRHRARRCSATFPPHLVVVAGISYRPQYMLHGHAEWGLLRLIGAVWHVVGEVSLDEAGKQPVEYSGESQGLLVAGIAGYESGVYVLQRMVRH